MAVRAHYPHVVKAQCKFDFFDLKHPLKLGSKIIGFVKANQKWAFFEFEMDYISCFQTQFGLQKFKARFLLIMLFTKKRIR